MALSRNIKLHTIDHNIRRIVLNLNRIPRIDTPNCFKEPTVEVYDSINDRMIMEETVYFEKPRGQHDTLIRDIEKYCNNNRWFSINATSNYWTKNDQFTLTRIIEPPFEEYEENRFKIGPYLQRENQPEIEDPLRKTWFGVNEIVRRYIIANISLDPKGLPFRKKEEKLYLRIVRA